MIGEINGLYRIHSPYKVNKNEDFNDELISVFEKLKDDNNQNQNKNENKEEKESNDDSKTSNHDENNHYNMPELNRFGVIAKQTLERVTAISNTIDNIKDSEIKKILQEEKAQEELNQIIKNMSYIF